MRTRIVAAVVVGALVFLPIGAAAQDILADAERLAAEFELQPGGASGGGRSMTRIATTLTLIGAGVGLAAMGKPDYVPSQFAPGNTPMRVDLTSYLEAPRRAAARPWRLRGVPTPVSCRMSNPRLKPQTCTSRRLRILGWPRRCTRRMPPVS